MKSTSRQAGRLRKIVALTLTDSNFRDNLIESPSDAINSKRKVLRFSYDGLTQSQQDVLDSLTKGDLESLQNIYQKAKKAGVKPVEMF